jgi:hypothetical protein
MKILEIQVLRRTREERGTQVTRIALRKDSFCSRNQRHQEVSFPSLSIHMEVDESHLEPETPSPVEDPHDPTFILNPTPDRPARLSSSLSNRQRLSLLDIDGGICFITRDRLPTISIQDAHIVQRRLSKEIVRASMCLLKFH